MAICVIVTCEVHEFNLNFICFRWHKLVSRELSNDRDCSFCTCSRLLKLLLYLGQRKLSVVNRILIAISSEFNPTLFLKTIRRARLPNPPQSCGIATAYHRTIALHLVTIGWLCTRVIADDYYLTFTSVLFTILIIYYRRTGSFNLYYEVS